MPPALEATLEPVTRSPTRRVDYRAPIEPAGQDQRAEGLAPSDPSGAMSLHISKLRGMTYEIRGRLKRQGITYTHQFLEAAACDVERRQLAASSGIDHVVLDRLVRRADLARIKGIGAIFADMLEMLGIDRVVRVADQDPGELHRALFELNARERLARRAPTPEEVQAWVAQARALPRLIDDEA